MNDKASTKPLQNMICVHTHLCTNTHRHKLLAFRQLQLVVGQHCQCNIHEQTFSFGMSEQSWWTSVHINMSIGATSNSSTKLTLTAGQIGIYYLYHLYHVLALISSAFLWCLINSSPQLSPQRSQYSQKCVSTTTDNELVLGCQFATFLVTSLQTIQMNNASYKAGACHTELGFV